MAGQKRLRGENGSFSSVTEESRRIAPRDYSFNFTPTLKPSQKLFDLDLVADNVLNPVEFSANILTYRFNKRLQMFQSKQKKPDLVVSKPPAIKTPYEPMYLRHQDISYTIITYLQLSFNVIIAAAALYILLKMFSVVRQDFLLKAQEHLDLMHKEKLDCIRNYEINHCGMEDRVPAIETVCNEWLSCIQKEATVPQTKVSAEAVAEILNSFVEPISFKTMAFFALLVLGSLVFSNLASRSCRRKHINAHPMQAIGHH